jgi:hypothetical protein
MRTREVCGLGKQYEKQENKGLAQASIVGRYNSRENASNRQKDISTSVMH